MLMMRMRAVRVIMVVMAMIMMMIVFLSVTMVVMSAGSIVIMMMVMIVAVIMVARAVVIVMVMMLVSLSELIVLIRDHVSPLDSSILISLHELQSLGIQVFVDALTLLFHNVLNVCLLISEPSEVVGDEVQSLTALASDDDDTIFIRISRECPAHLLIALTTCERNHEHTSLSHELGAFDVILCELIKGCFLLRSLRGLSLF